MFLVPDHVDHLIVAAPGVLVTHYGPRNVPNQLRADASIFLERALMSKLKTVTVYWWNLGKRGQNPDPSGEISKLYLDELERASSMCGLAEHKLDPLHASTVQKLKLENIAIISTQLSPLKRCITMSSKNVASIIFL